MKRSWLALLTLLSSSLAAAGGTQPSWLVRVQSTYQDELSKKPTKITGSGFIAKIGDQFVVICDSHLSQGDSGLRLDATQGELRAKTGKRLANNDHDIEMIPIEDPGIRDYFEFDGKAFRMTQETFSRSTRGTEMLQMSKTGVMPVAPWAKARPVPVSLKQSFPIVGGLFMDKMNARLDGELSERWDGKELISESQVVAGMSGEPILLTEGDTIVVGGISKAYHRHWTRSFFSTPQQLEELARQLSSGKTGLASETRWRYRGFTYRDFGDGTLEINPTQPNGTEIIPTGGGDSADGGGGDSADGGGGDSADGGNSDKSGALRNVPYSSLGIGAGMLWKGQPVLAFKTDIANFAKTSSPAASYTEGEKSFVVQPSMLKFSGSDTREAIVYASEANRRLLESIALDPSKIQPIGMDADFYELFRDRVTSVFYFRHHNQLTECYIDPSAPNGTIRIRLPQSLDLTYQHLTSKPYIVELDRHGVVKGSGQKQFEPFLVLSDPKRDQTVTVDLRGLFFGEFSRVTDRSAPSVPLTTPHIVLKMKDTKEWPIICHQTDNPEIFKQAELYTTPCSPANDQTGLGDFIESVSKALTPTSP